MDLEQLPPCLHKVAAFGVDGQRWIAISPLAQACHISIWDIKTSQWTSKTICMKNQMEVLNHFKNLYSDCGASIYDRRNGYFYFYGWSSINHIHYPALFRFDVNTFELVDLKVNFPPITLSLPPAPLMAILGDILHIISAKLYIMEHYKYNLKTGHLNPSYVMESTAAMDEIQLGEYLVPLEDRDQMMLFGCGEEDDDNDLYTVG